MSSVKHECLGTSEQIYFHGPEYASVVRGQLCITFWELEKAGQGAAVPPILLHVDCNLLHVSLVLCIGRY